MKLRKRKSNREAKLQWKTHKLKRENSEGLLI